MMADPGGQGNPSKMVDEELLKSEVAILTGGRDQFGRPLVVFPGTNLDKMVQLYTAAHVVLLLQYYITIGQTEAQHRGFAFIANLLSCPKEGVQVVVETLDKIQSEVRGSVAVLYAIPPKAKDLQKTFKKLVGIRPSKKHPKVATYETIVVENTAGLQRYISVSHLTSDLGGTMTFNHQQWVQFQQEVTRMETLAESTLERVPEAQDKVAMLSEYDIPDGSSESEELLLQVRTKYNDIMRDLNLEHLIDQCKELHQQMITPSKHPDCKDIAMVMAFTLTESKVKMEEHRNLLVKAREKLKVLWQHAEGRIVIATRVKKYKAKAEKVGEWMQSVGLPTVNQDPEIADCLSKAEILKNHFETGFLAIAQNVLWLSEKILKKLNSVILEVSGKSRVQGGTSTHIETVLKYTRQFEATIEYFKKAVNKKHQVYLNVHSFFLSATRVTKWYRRTLHFLPVQLIEPNVRFQSNRAASAAPYLSEAWRAAVDDYVLRHPLPANENLVKMKNVIPVIDNIGIRNQARLLVSRVTLLRKLLVSPDKVTPIELKDVLHWKDQVTQGHDDICLNLTTSTVDLSRIHDPRRPYPTPAGRPSASQGSPTANWSDSGQSGPCQNEPNRTPKLKYIAAGENGYFDELMRVNGQYVESGRHNQAERTSRGQHHLLMVSKSYEDLCGHVISSPAPRLDLQPLDTLNDRDTQSSQAAQRHENMLAIKRQESFGVYGQDEEPRKARQRLRRDIHRNTSPNYGSRIHGPGVDDERYVTLGGGTETPRSSELPMTLKHIDIRALKNNLPQNHVCSQTPDGSTRDKEARLNSYESLADSGIANTQSSPEGSGMSVSTTELSPSLSIGNGRMAVLMEGEEPQQDTDNPLDTRDGDLLCRSLPSLAVRRQDRLSLNQCTIDSIIHSSLSAEEKLSLMAAMCECETENEASGQRLVSIPPDVQHRLYDSGIHMSMISDAGGQNLLVTNQTSLLETSNSFPEVVVPEHITPGSNVLPSKQPIEAEPQGWPANSWSRTPKLTKIKDPNHTSLPTGNSPLRVPPVEGVLGTVGYVSPSVTSNPVSAGSMEPATHRPDQDNQPTLQDHGVYGTETGSSDQGKDHSSTNQPGTYPRYTGYGIDIEAWMRTQEEESRPVTDEGKTGMREYVEKLRNAKESRVTEERELERARETLAVLEVEEEEFTQEEVERSLRRTERLLQEQERGLEKSQDDDSVERGMDCPEDRTEDTMAAAAGEARGPDVWESSQSGESGVFTQTSSASFRPQPRHSLSSNSTRGQLSKGRIDSQGNKVIDQKDLIQSRSDLVKTSSNNRAKSTKLKPVRQVDFRDRLVERTVRDDPVSPSSDRTKYIECNGYKLELEEKCLEEGPSSETPAHPTAKNGYIPDNKVITKLWDPAEGVGGTELRLVGMKGTTESEDHTEVVMSSEVTTLVTSPRSELAAVRGSSRHGEGVQPETSGCETNGSLTVHNLSVTESLGNSVPSNVQYKPVIRDRGPYGEKSAASKREEPCHGDVVQSERRGRPERSAVKGHADMTMKVEAGGGSAWTNAKCLPSHSMEFVSLKTPIIIDNGSGICKCGFADQPRPNTFPALVGRAKYEDVTLDRSEQVYVGSAAQTMRGVLKLHNPIEHGIVTDWDDMELIWNHAFTDELRVDPVDHPVLVTEAPLNPLKHRERMMELLFDTFNVPAMYVAIQAVLALYSTGRTTGVVLDSGDGVSHVVPIYEGYSLPHAIQRLDLAGRDLTRYLSQLMYDQGVALTTSAEQQIVQEIKEQMCYVTANYEQELDLAANNPDLLQYYTMPDGHSVPIATERFRCPEALFRPSLIGREHGGLHNSIYTSITKCDIDLRTQLFSNIVLSGGTTGLAGFPERLQREVSLLAPPGVSGHVNVVVPEEREYSVWRGGAVLSTLPTFTHSWITVDEYQEFGDSIVHTKCF